MVFLYSTRVEKSYLYFDSTKKLAIDGRSLAFCSARGMFTSDPFFRASARAKIHFPRSRRPVSRAAKAVARYFFEITRQPVGLNASRDSFTRFECPPPQIQSCFQPLVFSPLLFSIDRSSACKVIVRG